MEERGSRFVSDLHIKRRKRLNPIWIKFFAAKRCLMAARLKTPEVLKEGLTGTNARKRKGTEAARRGHLRIAARRCKTGRVWKIQRRGALLDI